MTDIKALISNLAQQAIENGADANDTTGVVRAMALSHGWGFDAWFCICCEIADVEARSLGYENAAHRAFQLAETKFRKKAA